MTEGISLELATVADAPRIARLSRDELESGLGWRWRSGAVARLMGQHDTEVVVARAPGGLLAGFAALELGEQDAELLLLAVDRRVRRRGVGQALLRFLEVEAREAGAGSLWLHVRVGNVGALRFYEGSGFTVREYLPGHYGGRQDGLRLERRLIHPGMPAPEFEVLRALLRGDAGRLS